MVPKFFIIILLLGINNICLGQESSLARKMELKVLHSNCIGRSLRFNASGNKGDKNVIQLKYLGSVQTKDNVIYKIVTWARIWGTNFHTTGVIELFDVNNKYIGKYVLGNIYDLPSKIEKNNLIFINKLKSGCEKNLVTKINFETGIPQSIFLKCRGEEGDIYSFEATR